MLSKHLYYSQCVCRVYICMCNYVNKTQTYDMSTCDNYKTNAALRDRRTLSQFFSNEVSFVW